MCFCSLSVRFQKLCDSVKILCASSLKNCNFNFWRERAITENITFGLFVIKKTRKQAQSRWTISDTLLSIKSNEVAQLVSFLMK